MKHKSNPYKVGDRVFTRNCDGTSASYEVSEVKSDQITLRSLTPFSAVSFSCHWSYPRGRLKKRTPRLEIWVNEYAYGKTSNYYSSENSAKVAAGDSTGYIRTVRFVEAKGE